MEIEKVIELIKNKYGEDVDIVFYPDFSGHISSSFTKNCDSVDLYSWESTSELLKNLSNNNVYVIYHKYNLYNDKDKQYIDEFGQIKPNELGYKIFTGFTLNKLNCFRFGSKKDCKEFLKYYVGDTINYTIENIILD